MQLRCSFVPPFSYKCCRHLLVPYAALQGTQTPPAGFMLKLGSGKPPTLALMPGPKKVSILSTRSVHMAMVMSFFVSNSSTRVYSPSLTSSRTPLSMGVNLRQIQLCLGGISSDSYPVWLHDGDLMLPSVHQNMRPEFS